MRVEEVEVTGVMGEKGGGDVGETGEVRRLDLSTLRSEADIEAALTALDLEEQEVGERLAGVLEGQVGLEQRLGGVLALAPSLQAVSADSEHLAALVTHTAALAERVAAKVRVLDLAKSRVAECQTRVKDLLDLRACSEGVALALEEEDYEQAAAHIHRFLAMDEQLLKVTGRGLEGGAGLEASLATLHEAETRVRGVVARRFAEAVREEDLASIERFFKIFPLLGMHDEGIASFTGYLCSKLVESSRRNLKAALDTPASSARAQVILADTLTLLFEGVARVVEIHQPLIETYYGPGRLPVVLARIQVDCDAQAALVFQEFRKRRGIRDKVARVEAAGATRATAREVEPVLGEMVLLQARVDMYARFVRKRCGQDIETSEEEAGERARKVAGVEAMLAGSGLARAAQESLGEYIALEQHFMAENLRLAISLDSMEADQLTTSMLDDVFFIIKKCIGRATTTHNVDGICAVINNAVTLLESEFVQVFVEVVRAGLPSTYLDSAYSALQAAAATGKLAPAADSADRQRQLFLAYLNNAESGGEYITRLQDKVAMDLQGLQAGASAKQGEKMASCLLGLPAVAARLRSVRDSGLAALRTSAVRPRLKPWMDAFAGVSHGISEQQLAEYAANDPWVQQTIVSLDALVQGFRPALTPANFDSLVMLVASEAAALLEKAVLRSSFSRLGGLQLDKEVRSLSSFLSSITTWTIRDKFARLSQMAALLNLESLGEVGEVGLGQGGGRLVLAEVRLVLGLRTDFAKEEIKRLRLS